jgi:hypothetical protein
VTTTSRALVVVLALVVAGSGCSDDAEPAAEPATASSTAPSSTDEGGGDGGAAPECEAVAHVAAVAELPSDFDAEVQEGMGGGAEPAADCVGHLASDDPGRHVTVVESSSPFAAADAEAFDDYELGVVEDGFVVDYLGDGLPDHYLLLNGMDRQEATVLAASL